MPEFDALANRDSYESHSVEKQKILNNLKTLIIDSKALLEGSSFYHHASLNVYESLYTKQLNLFWCGKQAITKICEIGFNAGHSTMLLLLGRDKTPLDFTIFDIGHHAYTKPCVNYIKSQFSHINFEYIEGDSTLTMPLWINANKKHIGLYDVVHVDGGHSEYCVSNDMRNADLLVKRGGLIIIDDTNLRHINRRVDLYVSSDKYSEIDILETKGYPHRIIKKNIEIPPINHKNLTNLTYSWENHTITFLENGGMNAFGKGKFTQFNTYTYEAEFGGRVHVLVFNNDYTEFTSTRFDDGYIVKGKIIQ